MVEDLFGCMIEACQLSALPFMRLVTRSQRAFDAADLQDIRARFSFK